MQSLEPPDSFHVQAAKAWLEEGKAFDAQQEFDKIAPPLQNHPAVLELQWAIQARARNWEASLKTAQAIVTLAPERPNGWISRSFVLHRLKRTTEALNQLFPAVEKFSTIPIIPFNLACYAAHLQDLWEAGRWLQQACAVGGDLYIRLALSERALQPLWKKIY